MKIEKWQVENGIATLKNPHSHGKEWVKFYLENKEHEYATDAPPGIHSAEMFGEVELQIRIKHGNTTWGNWKNVTEKEYDRFGQRSTLEKRQFLPFKHPVEPNDKQCPPDFLELCSIMETGKVHLVNPNANAIKAIEQYMVDLEDEYSIECERAYSFGLSSECKQSYNNKLSTCNHILKLLQS